MALALRRLATKKSQGQSDREKCRSRLGGPLQLSGPRTHLQRIVIRRRHVVGPLQKLTHTTLLSNGKHGGNHPLPLGLLTIPFRQKFALSSAGT